MANINNSKPIVLNGVGTAYLNVVNNGILQTIPLGTLQSMKLAFSGSLDKVYGGDSLVPIYLIDKDQTVNLSFTEAQFDLEWLQFSNGAVMSNNGQLISSTAPTLIASGTTFTVPGTLSTIVPSSAIVLLSSDPLGTINVTSLSYTSGVPTAGQFAITAAGVITLGTSVTNQYISVNCIYTDTVSRTATVTTASVPGFISIRHTSKLIPNGDGTNCQIHTQIFKAKATGKLDVSQERQKASAPVLEFEVFYDQTRTDGSIISMTQVNC